ncbi:MAG: alpha/beta fold hydrolase [Pseudonocardiaceae bacterium]|nr:alpha/beta fold hydrolase [Pseudonocardiaceae bacterium]
MAGEVMATDGVLLQVHESGRRGGPTVVCVHGYPDDHTAWGGVAAELAPRYHVVSFDVRGAGGSGQPRNRAAYRLDQLAADLTAVIDAASPDRSVHLLAHDWGAIQVWHALTGESLRAATSALRRARRREISDVRPSPQRHRAR